MPYAGFLKPNGLIFWSVWTFRKGLLPETLGGGLRPACPIYDQNLRFSLPYLWPDQKFDTLFMTWILNHYTVSDWFLVQTDVKSIVMGYCWWSINLYLFVPTFILSLNKWLQNSIMMNKWLPIEHSQVKIRMLKSYPIYDQNGQNLYPIYNQTGWKTIPLVTTHTYIAHIREQLPTPHRDETKTHKSNRFT